MKKRLLSAALALAMVLTLLPVAAFADPVKPSSASIGDSGQTGLTYYFANNSTSGIDGAPGWFYQYKMTEAGKEVTKWAKLDTASEAGVLYGGRFYKTADFKKSDTDNSLPGTTFTVLGNVSLPVGDATSLNVDIYGGTLTLTGNGAKLTSLTVNDTKWSQEQYITGRTKGELSFNVTRAAGDDEKTGLTIKADNVKLGTFSLQNAASRTVTLTNCEAAAITLKGKSDNSQSQTITATSTIITGKIIVDGNSSRVTLKDVAGNNTGAGGVDLEGTGASLTVQGSSNIGAVSLATGVSDTTKKTAAGLTLDVQGGKVGAVTGDSGEVTTAYTIKVGVNGKATSIVTTSIKNANVTIDSGECGAVTLPNGKLTVSGSYAKVTGAVALGGSATDKAELSVTGNHHTFGDAISSTAGTITVGIPAEPTNKFVSISLPSSYAASPDKNDGIKGGTWTGNTAPSSSYLITKGNDAIKFILSGTNSHTFYNPNQLGEALTAQKHGTSLTLKTVNALASPITVTFKDGAGDLGTVQCAPYETFILPTLIDGRTYTNWWDTAIDWPAGGGKTYSVPVSGTPELNAKSSTNAVTKINGLTAVTSGDADAVNLLATISGNQISLSGAVKGSTDIKLDLKTDMQDAVISATAYYDESNNTLTWANQSLTGGMRIVVGSNGELVLQLSNKTEYTLNNAGIKVPSKKYSFDVDATGKKIVVENVSGTAAASDGLKKQVIDMISGSGSEFDWTGVTAMNLALNQAKAGVTDSQVESWVKAAQRAAYTYHDKGSYTDTELNSTGYDTVKMVPYLAVNVTDYKPGGSITMTLTPSYRIEVKQSTVDSDWALPDNTTYPGSVYIAQKGTLGALNDDLMGAGIKVKFKSTLGTQPFTIMHQDGTYVYKYDTTATAFVMKHTGKTGLGTVVINATEPLVTLYDGPGTNYAGATPKGYYNSIQAAVDDTEATASDGTDDLIIVSQDYGDVTVPISVSGKARTFIIRTVGNTKITSATSGGALVDPDTSGHVYTVKLNEDTAPQGGNVTVSSATGGSARVDKNPATYGQIVTITVTPDTGYVSGTPSVKTASGTSVPVSGSGNTYTFTMPSGAVTVTPSFTASNTKAIVTVSNPSTATTNADSSGVPVGSTVTVYTTPSSGQRSMSLNVTGGTNVQRTGKNQFTFTVLSGYSNVTVTPTFDWDNGTNFSDVWNSDWYSPWVAWAVNNGITTGTGDYTFGPNDPCTRAQIVTFLWRNAGRPSTAGMTNPFYDVSPSMNSDLYNAIIWANNKGITQGDGSKTIFNPNKTVTRAEAVTFLYRYMGQPSASSYNNFTDVSSSAWYARAVTWAVNKGVTNGDGSSTRFNPNGNCLRSHIVGFLYKNAFGHA